jgi:hypothetical protein
MNTLLKCLSKTGAEIIVILFEVGTVYELGRMYSGDTKQL